MDDDAPEPARPATALAGALLSGAAALVMAGAAHTLRPPASHKLGEDVLIAWILVACAVIGVLFCVYLTVIWGLAAAVLAAGPASRLGAALLLALRVLAPQVARRVVVSTALAATATGLALAPATAADRSLGAGAVSPAPVSVSSELTPSDSSEPGTGAEAEDEATADTDTDTDTDTEADTGADDPSSTAASDGRGTEPGPLPALGWGGEDDGAAPSEPDADDAEAPGAAAPESSGNEAGDPPPSSTTGADPDLPAQPSPPGHGSFPAPAQSAPAPSTVVVQPGDTLWSITDDLLGPVPDSPPEIAAAWPLLHESNRDVIGTDPDLLEPGQELLVPAPLSSQEQ